MKRTFEALGDLDGAGHILELLSAGEQPAGVAVASLQAQCDLRSPAFRST